MKKLFKRISLILAAAVAVACMGVFAVACTDDNGGGKTSYTITVEYSDGSAVDGTATGMTVQICEYIIATGKLGACYGTYNVGADGKATIPAEDYWTLKNNTKYHWQINNPPAGYVADEDTVLQDAPGDLTIKLVSSNG